MNLRLLADENFPAPSVRLLRAAGHDVFAVAENTPRVDDSTVLRQAIEQRRWLVTLDTDHGELIFNQHLSSPETVFLLRGRSFTRDEPGALLLKLLGDRDDLAGKFWVIERDRVRSRPLLRDTHANG